MKKQFFRVKQLADQTFSRAGKTEVLSDDLQGADRRVEVIRNACQNTSKKMASSLLAQGQDPAATREKRLKRSAEYMLGMTMLECGDRNDEEGLLGNAVVECGKLQMALANEVVEHEGRVEERVVTLLHAVSEGEVPSILKHKRNLAKLILDMDSARTRYQTAVKHSTGQGGTAKVDAIREELEDAELKVEQCRDQLASEMFQLISREAELAQTIVEYARLQRKYHEKALSVLDDFLPDLESSVNDSHIRPVFGAPLEEHLRVTSRKIAFPIELCVCALLELGMEEEGLFRVAGGSSKVRRMKLSLDAACLTFPTALEYRDPHVIAGVLKSYLRELPEPLMTYSLYEEWMAAAKVSVSNDARLQALWTVVQKLPEVNRDNLRYLVKFLAALCRNQDINKMSPQNIAIVIAPNLIWSPTCSQDSANIGLNMSTANFCSVIVDSLVTFADWFFPGEVDFYVTLSKEVANELLNGGTTPSHQGHARSSSGDAQLVDTSSAGVMQRTQSSSSLSDLNNSPPQGSPKPATRHKKKPAAPVPPISTNSNHTPHSSHTVSTGTGSKTIMNTAPSSTVPNLTSKSERPGKPPPPVNAPPLMRPIEKPAKPPPPVICQEKTSVSVNTSTKLVQRDPGVLSSSPPAETVSKTSPVEKKLDASSSKIGFEYFMTESNNTATVTSGQPTNCDIHKGNSGGDEITTSSQAVCPSPAPTSSPASKVAENAGNGSSSSTLERKRLHRPMPVAAPRTTLLSKSENLGQGAGQAPLATAEDEFVGITLRKPPSDGTALDPSLKPAVPERPATLQRPLSSSFRMVRPTSDPPITVTNTCANITSHNSGSSNVSSSSCSFTTMAPSVVAPSSASTDDETCSSSKRSTDESGDDILERNKISVSDKQQVSVIRVGGSIDNLGMEPQGLQRTSSLSGRPNNLSVHNSEKPERPPKPELMPVAADRMSGGTQSTSQTAHAETGECTLPTGGQFGSLPRPPRPQPPPPPPPARARADSAAESTDL